MVSKKILLLRHGETDWNIELRFQGSRDIPLNARGEEQAKRVSQRVRPWAPEVVVSSPLQRALKTAALVSGRSEKRITVDPLLSEISFGIWEGCSTRELNSQGELFSIWKQEPFSVPVPEAESENDIIERARAVVQKLTLLPQERVLVVSHGGTLRALLAVALQIPFRSAWKYFRLSNCSLTGLEYSAERFVLAFYNDHICGCETDDGGRPYAPVTF